MPTIPNIDHARSMELRLAVLAILDQFTPDNITSNVYIDAYYWAAYAQNYGIPIQDAALFGAVQAAL